MKHINNKGFTLVEVLAVLVILTIIISIAIPSISSSIGRSKSTQNAIRYNFLENKAEEYVGDNKSEVINSLTGGVNECYIEISTLISKGYVSEKEAKDSDGNSLDKYIIYNYEDNTYKYSTLVNGLSKCGASPVSNNGSSDESKDDCKNVSIKLGDYFEMTPTLTSYRVDTTADGTGLDVYNEAVSNSNKVYQKDLNPSKLSLWRIIDLNKLDLVSVYTSDNLIYFYGAIGYINYVKVLNDVSYAYGNEKYTKATRSVGGNIDATSVLNIEKKDLTVNNLGVYATGSDNWDSSSELYGGGDHFFNNDNLPYDLSLIKNACGKFDATTISKDSTSTSSKYWIPSRYYTYDEDERYTHGRWNVWGVKSTSIESHLLYWSSSNSYYYNGITSAAKYFRPIITLKTLGEDICVNGGDGTKGEPYKLKVIT